MMTKINNFVSMVVEASVNEVVDELGPKILDVKTNPEMADTIGRMVAARAICISRMLKYRYALGRGSVIGAIGRTSLDLDISTTGEVSLSIRQKTSTKGKEMKFKGMILVPLSLPIKKSNEVKVEKGNTIVVKNTDGTTTIHIDQLNVYITADIVKNLIVNPQQVMTMIGDELTKIAKEAKETTSND